MYQISINMENYNKKKSFSLFMGFFLMELDDKPFSYRSWFSLHTMEKEKANFSVAMFF